MRQIAGKLARACRGARPSERCPARAARDAVEIPIHQKVELSLKARSGMIQAEVLVGSMYARG